MLRVSTLLRVVKVVKTALRRCSCPLLPLSKDKYSTFSPIRLAVVFIILKIITNFNAFAKIEILKR